MDRRTIIDRYRASLTWSTGQLEDVRCKPILDLGVADAFEAPDPSICAALSEGLKSFDEHTYTLDRYEEFVNAASAWLETELGCKIDAQRGIVHTLGAKGGLELIALALVEAGSVVAVTVPGYPVFESWARILGAEVVLLPLRTDRDYLPDLEAIPAAMRGRVTVVIVNYPNNPTGKVATAAELAALLAFCRREGIVLVNDAAYASIIFDPDLRPSLLTVAAPDDRVLEVHSLSKTFQMPGWRLGFVAGTYRLIERLRAVRPLLDSGQFRAVQRAGAVALRARPGVARRNRVLECRLRQLAAILSDVGFPARVPKGTPFLYVPAPVAACGEELTSAVAAARVLLRECGVLVTPWDDLGPHLRVSAAFRSEPGGDDTVLSSLRDRLSRARLRFAPSTASGCPSRVLPGPGV